MNLTNLRTRILSRIGRTKDDTLDNDITYALESVQDEIVSDIPFVELLTFDTSSLVLSGNIQDYNLPDDFAQPVIFWNNDNFEQELIRLNPIEYSSVWGRLTKEKATNPIYYDIMDSAVSGLTYRKKIKFFPFPSSLANGICAAFAQASGAAGSITAFTDYNSTVAGTVLITDAAHGLVSGMEITISATTNYNGTFEVTVVDVDNFYIHATYIAEVPAGLEAWTATGTSITDVDHGLATGNSVTISGTTNYNGTYEIIKIDDDTFYIDATYVAEATAYTKVWEKTHLIPMVYLKFIDYLSTTNTENILSYVYPQLYIEGAAYYMYRDVIYRDQPEKIAFRRAEFDRVKNQVIKDNIQTDRVGQVIPKRLLSSVHGKVRQLFRTQYSNYTS